MLLQAKADEIAKLMNDNELLKSTIEDLKVGMDLDVWCSLFIKIIEDVISWLL